MRFSTETLKGFTIAILSKAGYEGADAALFADSLIAANERGVASHGITRLPFIYPRSTAQAVSTERSFGLPTSRIVVTPFFRDSSTFCTLRRNA